MTAIRYDQHIRTFDERRRIKKGIAKAIVATAKDMLVIIWYMVTRHEVYRYKDNTRYERNLYKLNNTRILRLKKDEMMPGKLVGQIFHFCFYCVILNRYQISNRLFIYSTRFSSLILDLYS